MCCQERVTPSDECLASLLGDEVSPIFLALAAMMSAVGAAHAQAPLVLLQQYRCYSCHADDEAKTSPAYVDDTYRGDPQAVGIVAAAISKGIHDTGPWHMPPNRGSDIDAKKIVEYILSLKK